MKTIDLSFFILVVKMPITETRFAHSDTLSIALIQLAKGQIRIIYSTWDTIYLNSASLVWFFITPLFRKTISGTCSEQSWRYYLRICLNHYRQALQLSTGGYWSFHMIHKVCRMIKPLCSTLKLFSHEPTQNLYIPKHWSTWSRVCPSQNSLSSTELIAWCIYTIIKPFERRSFPTGIRAVSTITQPRAPI